MFSNTLKKNTLQFQIKNIRRLLLRYLFGALVFVTQYLSQKTRNELVKDKKNQRKRATWCYKGFTMSGFEKESEVWHKIEANRI